MTIFLLLVINFGLLFYYRVYVKAEMKQNKIPETTIKEFFSRNSAAIPRRQVEDANNFSDSSRSWNHYQLKHASMLFQDYLI